MKAVLRQDRWRPLDAGVRYVPHRILKELYKEELPEDLKHLADEIDHPTPTPVMATKQEELHVLVAREMAHQRIEHPTADILIIYNGAREKIAPAWPEVSAIRYMRQDVMDQLLLELEDLTRQKSAEPEEKPLSPYQKQCMVVGEAIAQLTSLKASAAQIGDSEITKRMHEFEVSILAKLEKRFGDFKKEIEDTVMDMLVKPAESAEKDVVNGAPPTETPAPSETLKVFKVLAVDPILTQFKRHIEAKLPKNVKFEIGNADHTPSSTPSSPHFFIMTRRTPAPWVREYRRVLHVSRVIELQGGGVEDFVKVLNEISQRPWFER
jgi:hypothetical protein